MLRRLMIALVATTFMITLAGSTTADARGGGFGRWYAWRGRRLLRGWDAWLLGWRLPHILRWRLPGCSFAGPCSRRCVGFVGRPFIGPRHFAFRPGFAPGFAFRNRVFFGNRFFPRNRFAFAAVPFGVGLGFYGASCWSWQPTPWGWQRVWVCGNDFGY